MADFTLFRYNFRDGLYFVTGSSFQILGNENKGKRLVVAKLCGGMYKSSTLRSSRFGFLNKQRRVPGKVTKIYLIRGSRGKLKKD